MVIRPMARPAATSILPITGRDVGLHPDDRLEASLASLLLELPRPKHAPVIGQRESRHFELQRSADQVAEPIGSVQEGVFRMSM